MKKRDEIIDILRGFAICLIVLGHTNFVGTGYIYLFHVAVFIIASGMFFRIDAFKDFRSLLNYIRRKFLSLYVPYVIINFIFLLMNNILIKINIYSLDSHKYFEISDYLKNTIKILCFRGTTELGGATWFLHLLFILTIAYAITSFVLNKIFKLKSKNVKIGQTIISLILLITGFLLTMIEFGDVFSIYVIAMNCYWLFTIGMFINYFKDILSKARPKIVIIIVLIISLFLLKIIGSIEISKNMYTSPLFFVICSLIGWFMLYYLSMILSRFKVMSIMKYLGRNSLYILLFHFVGFKIVNLLIYLFVSHNVSDLSAFPTAVGGIYSVLYFIFGIVISLIIYQLFTIIKKTFKKGNK